MDKGNGKQSGGTSRFADTKRHMRRGLSLFNAYKHSCSSYPYGCWQTQNTVVRSVLQQMLCPSDSSPTIWPSFAVSNYAGCWGNGGMAGCGYPYGWTCAYGTMFHISHIRIRDVDDGTSQTIAFGEIDEPSTRTMPLYSTTYCKREWGNSYVTRILRATGAPINSCPQTAILYAGRLCYPNAFGSRHEGGAFFTMCDGSTKFITESIDSRTFSALGTRNGNELIDDTDY